MRNEVFLCIKYNFFTAEFPIHVGIGGSVVECSAPTRAARIRFPADAVVYFACIYIYVFKNISLI